MKKFLLGVATYHAFLVFSPQIIKFLNNTIAKLELHQDILKHDNPDIS